MVRGIGDAKGNKKFSGSYRCFLRRTRSRGLRWCRVSEARCHDNDKRVLPLFAASRVRYSPADILPRDGIRSISAFSGIIDGAYRGRRVRGCARTFSREIEEERRDLRASRRKRRRRQERWKNLDANARLTAFSRRIFLVFRRLSSVLLPSKTPSLRKLKPEPFTTKRFHQIIATLFSFPFPLPFSSFFPPFHLFPPFFFLYFFFYPISRIYLSISPLHAFNAERRELVSSRSATGSRRG